VIYKCIIGVYVLYQPWVIDRATTYMSVSELTRSVSRSMSWRIYTVNNVHCLHTSTPSTTNDYLCISITSEQKQLKGQYFSKMLVYMYIDSS